MIQLELGEAGSNFGLTDKDSKVGLLIEIVAIRVQEDWTVADTEDFEGKCVSVGISGSKFRKNVEVTAVAVAQYLQLLQLWRTGEISLLVRFDLSAICRSALRHELATLRSRDSPAGPEQREAPSNAVA